MKSLWTVALAVVIALMLEAPAQAAPIEGTQVRAIMSGECCGVFYDDTVTIGAAVEFPGNFGLQADLSDTTLRLISFTGNSTSIGTNIFWEFTLDPSLVWASVSETSDNFGRGAELLSITGNVARFRILDTGHSRFTTYEAAYAISVTQAVPEPASLSLAATALLAAAGALRRRRG